MSHKTLISGTAYEISGGKTLIDGTAYSIKNGKTLVDGTVYEVGFVKEYVALYDFGTLSDLGTTLGGRYKEGPYIDSPIMPFDFSDVTHMSVNGEIFELSGAVEHGTEENINKYRYRMLGDTTLLGVSADYPYMVTFMKYDRVSDYLYPNGYWVPTFYAYSKGTYNVSIGKYE